MHDSQAAQGLHQVELAGIERAKLLVAIEQRLELWLLLIAFARKEHPQVLYRRAGAAVVEVNNMEAVFIHEDVAGVEIAVQAQDVVLTAALGTVVDAIVQLLDELFVVGGQLCRYEIVVEQKITRIQQVTFDVDTGPVVEIVLLADEMGASHEAAELLKHVEVVEFRRTAAASRKHREAKIVDVQQRLAVDLDWRDHGKVMFREFEAEGVLLEDRLVTPAIRAIELDDDRCTVFDTDLVNPVLIRIQREQPAVAGEAGLVQRIEEVVRDKVAECQVLISHGAHDTLAPALRTAESDMVRAAALVLAFLVFNEAAHAGEAISPEDHLAEVEAWREGRMQRLKAPAGYLNLAGLFWLKEGTSTFGSGEGNTLVFPGVAPDTLGRFELSDGVVTMIADQPGVRSGTDEVTSIVMIDDTGEEPVTVTYKSLAWTVINRVGKVAVRLRDFEHPGLVELKGFEFFPVDARYRLEARLVPFDEPRVMNVDTVIEGLGYNPTSPGRLEFEIDGVAYQLDAYQSGDRLFFVFGDRTNGYETYPAGRFVYTEAPGEDGMTIIDFNQSYSPPCAFNDFSTCPVASPSNRLKVRIESGEKYSKKAFWD